MNLPVKKVTGSRCKYINKGTRTNNNSSVPHDSSVFSQIKSIFVLASNYFLKT